MSVYRHEYKYQLDEGQEMILRTRAQGLLQPDPHVTKDGTYIIRSLYFDNIKNTCLKDNLSGADPRSKYRVRYYGNDLTHISFEKKSKVCGMTRKEACSINVDEFRRLCKGMALSAGMEGTKGRLFAEAAAKGIRPAVIVTYERIPYVYPGGNVRVTFDRCISASWDVEAFLSGEYRQTPVLPMGYSILEVKWDELLPLHIREVLALDRLQWSKFSKYTSCRMLKPYGTGVV